MRRILFAAIVALAAPLAPAAKAAPAAPSFTMAQRVDLTRVSTYLNAIHSMTARFMQIGPDGSSVEGTLYLKKPGRLRFEYNKPSPILVVSDGSTIAVSNSQLHTTDRYPLLNSPLRMILSDEVDLSSDSRVSQISRESGALSVTAKQDSGPAQGSITLTFADTGQSLELRQWQVIDAQGLRTVVVVSNIQIGIDIPARLFTIEDLSPFQHRGD